MSPAASTIRLCLHGLSIGALAWLLTTGCSNELQTFCEDASQDLCKQCWECAANDEEASAMCGLLAETDEEGCRIIITKVCSSDDSAYNGETAKACLERIDRMTCDQLLQTGKPEVCGRLF